ncbi:MAG TPA: DUF1015 domain-containing protein [Candidatus Kapabacteria bacterium]|nr:DUF1015 domain-containing protein [Candidatus Kapabacteria bacterium]
MPEFLPFLATRYNPSLVQIENVTSPPFDVISEEYRDILYARDPHNVIRLEWNRDANPYESAAKYFSEWKQAEILKREERPAFFVYRQIFAKQEGVEVTRSGVIGRLKLSPYSAGEVLPHERTHLAPKMDRFALMERIHANISPIFGLISDASFLFDQTIEVAAAFPPLADLEESLPSGDAVRHLLWRLPDDLAASRISYLVANTPVIIADGHHRYETAVEFHERHPEIRGSEYMMVFIANMHSEGTVILPTHRLLHDVSDFDQFQLLRKLADRFALIPFSSREEGMAELGRDDAALTLIEFPEDPKWMLVRDMRVRERESIDLPASRLEEEIFIPMLGLSKKQIDERRNILYPHTFRDVDEMEDSHSWNAVFYLRAVRPDEMQRVVERGGFMPQKTTYFYPKLLTGLLFHEFAAQSK